MELSLKDAISILDVVKTIDKYSIVLWLSLSVPIYYLAFKKLLPESDPAAENSFKQRIAKLFAVPKFESRVLFISLTLFIIGTIVVVYGKEEKERLRNLGWGLKNHLINYNYYRMSVSSISKETNISYNDLMKISAQFPKEFSIISKDSSVIFIDQKTKQKKGSIISRQTLILSDSVTKLTILKHSERILAAYLNNPAVLPINIPKSFDQLFNQNDYFTNDVIYRLIADSSRRYSFNYCDVNNKSAGFGIVKLK